MEILLLERRLTSGTHHGKPGLSQQAKIALAKEISPEVDRDLLSDLSASPVPGARQVAAWLLASRWVEDASWTPTVLALAMDSDWEVREWSVEPIYTLLQSPHPAARQRIEALARDPEPSVQRQLAVAIRQSARRGDDVEVEWMLELLDPMMPIEDPYLQKNLGAYAIGDGLLAHHASLTIPWLAGYVTHDASSARVNVARAFTTKLSRVHRSDGMKLLAGLRDDPSLVVRRAVAKAFRNLEIE